MFRKVRKKVNEISVELAKDLVKKSRRGILAVNGDDGYPYAIPINYLYDEESQKIFFHGSKAGYKLDSLKNLIKSVLLYMAMSISRKKAGLHIYKVR